MKSRIDAAAARALAGPGALVTGFGAALLSAAGAAHADTAAHDLDVVRTVGAGFAGPGGALRALDLVVASPALLLPIGTRVLRAGLASAVVTGLCAALAFELAFALATAAATRSTPARVSPRLAAAASAVAVLTAVLAPAWQAEAGAPGGAVTGVLLVLSALWLGVSHARAPAAWAAPAALVLGLSASYDPFVFLASASALAPRAVRSVRAARAAGEGVIARSTALHAAAAFVLGLVPIALGALLTRRPLLADIAIGAPLLSLPAGRAAGGAALGAFAWTHVGALVLVASAAGVALAVRAKEARAVAIPIALASGVGVLAVTLQPGSGGASGASRFAPAVLAGLLAVHVLAAAALAGVVVAIARARVPFAEASAALVVVLELVLPVRAFDETSTRREQRAAYASSIWNDVAWGDAPPASLVVVGDRGTMQRVAGARARGELRGDLLFVPAFDIHGREGQRALLLEPRLAPLYRDLALGVPPEELSLARLGAERPLLATFVPSWDRVLARHLVPVGLSARFEPEPRGVSDRRQALDAFAPLKDRLVRAAVAKPDPDLVAATTMLLRGRAIGIAATGERDTLSRALDDLRAFSPEDPVGATLVRRIVTSRGPIDVRDLSP